MSSDTHNPLFRQVIFSVGGQRYSLDITVVERALPMVAVAPLPRAPAIALGVISLHGQVIPVLDIRRRFGHPPREWSLSAHLLVARTIRRTLALPVDEVLGVREVAREAVTPPDVILPGIGHVSGIAALSDGLLFIHDLETFLSLDEEQQLTEALEGIGG